MKLLNPALLAFALSAMSLQARNYYISPSGDNGAEGSKAHPWKTLSRAQAAVEAGDTVTICSGTYRLTNEDIMTERGAYAVIFDLSKSGQGPKRRISYFAEDPKNRPVFDCSDVKPEGKRVSAFWVTGDWLWLRGFDIVGVQVVVKGHTQSECISMKGSHNVVDNLSMHDGMAIGYYQTKGSDDIVVNCDAYSNYDPYSEGEYGGNVDGFGSHNSDDNATGNMFIGCRAWWNSDDGFDLINNKTEVTIVGCWAFYNGYQPGGLKPAGDGTGIKAGGYGMGNVRVRPKVMPRNTVKNCIAFCNKHRGFYSNHHLGGINWYHNTAYKNHINFEMVNRQSREVARDTLGYDHVLSYNLSFGARRKSSGELNNLDLEKSVADQNSFGELTDTTVFLSLDPEELMKPRHPHGWLPEINFLKLKEGTDLYNRGFGYQF